MHILLWITSYAKFTHDAVAGDPTKHSDPELHDAGIAGLVWVLVSWSLTMVPLSARALVFSIQQNLARQNSDFEDNRPD